MILIEPWQGVFLSVELAPSQKVSRLALSTTSGNHKVQRNSIFGFSSLGDWVDHFMKTSIFEAHSDHLETKDWTPFQRQVYEALSQVAWGQTLTYKALATRLGSPGASRAVGTAMAQNPFPLILPCHRIVPSSGGVGQYAFGSDMKQSLLNREV